MDVLPELLWELPDNRVSVHRYHYYDHLTERFVSAYSDTIARWCGEHNIAMTGHYMSEPTLYSQTLRLGEAMRCYRGQQIPGIDILCGDPEYSTVKQAVSVARQFGRDAVISELYGVTHWDFDFKGHKLQGDWQAALGVTVRCHHLAYMSMEGEAKRDWPASINYQSPWYGEYPYIENYFARINTVMTRGKAVVNVGIIHPIESYWIHYGPVAETKGIRDQLDEGYQTLLKWLLFGTIDFDLLSEALIGEQTGEWKLPCSVVTEYGRVCLKVGKMVYQTILVPGLHTIRSTTLDLLEEFSKAGGKLLFAGNVPGLVDAEPSKRVFALAGKTNVIPYSQNDILEALEEDRIISIRFQDGRKADQLFYQLREDMEENHSTEEDHSMEEGSKEVKWLFVCHVNRRKNRTDQAEHLEVRIRGEYDITCYDALTGTTHEPDVKKANGFTVRTVTMYGEDSFLWKLTGCRKNTETLHCMDNGAAPINLMKQNKADGKYKIRTGKAIGKYGLVAGPAPDAASPSTMLECSSSILKAPRIIKIIPEPESYCLEEPNVLCLDAAAWQLDDGQRMPVTEILRLDNQIRTALHYPRRQDAFKQPWRIPEAPELNKVTLYYIIDSVITVDTVKLAMERPDKAGIWLNGSPCCEKQDGYYVDSFIRTVPLNGLQKGQNELVLEIPFGRKTNLENIYLLGEFGVEAKGTKAIITRKPEKLYFGDITRQCMPFYGGNLTYNMTFSLEEEQEISIRVPHFSSPVLKVNLDGRSLGLIAFSPHTIFAGKVAKGSHRLEICTFGNRFNTFGTLHNCNEEYKWYGPDSYRTKDSEWSEAWCLRPFGILSRVEILEGHF